ncbi:MAG: oxidative damage protection protein [Gammaproteobacteria bacterium]|nr:oxidative damage protection protein [Gammaproteobacteria bacterium]
MTRMVRCRKYGEELPGLDAPPFPGPKGQEIFDAVSKRAWEEWTAHQTMLINEHHLNMIEPDARKFLAEQREKFLDNQDYAQAEGYVPPDSKDQE